MVIDPRVKAFEQCLLNTCVQQVRGNYDGLALSNCREAEDFPEYVLLKMIRDPFFTDDPLEPEQEQARLNLVREFQMIYKQTSA